MIKTLLLKPPIGMEPLELTYNDVSGNIQFICRCGCKDKVTISLNEFNQATDKLKEWLQ